MISQTRHSNGRYILIDPAHRIRAVNLVGEERELFPKDFNSLPEVEYYEIVRRPYERYAWAYTSNLTCGLNGKQWLLYVGYASSPGQEKLIIKELIPPTLEQIIEAVGNNLELIPEAVQLHREILILERLLKI
jgi:hypothetical protein